MIELDENHIYRVDGLVVPGVSEILSTGGLVDLWGIPPFSLEAAKKLGTAVHFTCQHYDTGRLREQTVDMGIRPYLDAYIKFKREHCVEVIENEKSYYSAKWGFCGTLDRVFAIKGKIILCDLKTTTTMHPARDVQSAGYKLLYQETSGQKINQRWALQLLPGQYKVWPAKNSFDESVFISALQVYKWRKNNGCLKEKEMEREVFGGEIFKEGV